MSEENAAAWFDQAKETRVKKLAVDVAAALGEEGKEVALVKDGWTALVTPRQRDVVNHACEIAKRMLGRESLGDALEAVCLHLLSGAQDTRIQAQESLVLLIPAEHRELIERTLEARRLGGDLPSPGVALAVLCEQEERRNT